VSRFFSLRTVPLFIGALLILAYLEETLWDVFVWQEHGKIFGGGYLLSGLADASVLIWLVPFLAVPQATHYVLDGFIWKVRKPDQGFRTLL